MHIIYNPKRGSDIKDYWFGYKQWTIPRNSLFRCEEAAVANHFLETYGFLRAVKIEELEDVKKEMEDKEFKCKYCEKEFGEEKQLRGHMMGAHKANEEMEKGLEGIPVLSPRDGVPPIKRLSGDEEEGIPQSGKDKDGVEWYGAGVETDSPSSMKFVKPGMAGVFGA